MKNIFTLLFIAISTFAFSQIPAPRNHKSMNENKTTQNSFKVSDSNKKENISYLIEIKVIKTEKTKKIVIPKISPEKARNQRIEDKANLLTKITDMENDENFHLVSEMSLLGFKLVSHEFAIKKDTEIHYYIYEL